MTQMRHGQRVVLRASLLLGAAGAAASSAAFADPATSTPASDPPKWQPYSSIGGSAGTGMVGGKLDLFVPFFQNMDSLVFINLGVGTETKANVLYNVGLGYRTEIGSDWIVGAYANHDGTQLTDDNTLGQTSLGAELMSADWDIRLNGYLADHRPAPVPGQYSLYINGTTIAVTQAQDIGYSGFDGEVGYRVFATDTMDARIFVGGFSFMHDDTVATSTGERFDFSYRNITGPKARAELTVYDLDVIGNQSRLTVDGEIAHDDVRGTTGFVGATLRIPLGNFSGGGGAQALDELDRRMVDPERRNDTVLSRTEFTKPEPVVIYGPGVKSQPTNTLLYVDNTMGVGTYANPTTFADATSRNTTNAFIVITSKQGPVIGGGALQPGQTVVAGGETFYVQGVNSHATFSHKFDPSTNVTLMPSSPGANVITLAANTAVHGVNIVGDFGSAIYGKNVQNVTINNVNIDGTGGGNNGIDIVRTVSGNQNITISNTAISNLTGTGIRIDTNVPDGKNTTETFTGANLSINNVGADGIHIDAYAGDGSKITSTVTLSNASVTGAGADGIDIATDANGTGSSIGETLTATNLTVSGPHEDGIYIGTHDEAGAQSTSNATLTNLTISGAQHDGIGIHTDAVDGSAISQTLTLTNITINNPASDGIQLQTTTDYAGTISAGYAATISSAMTLSNVTVTNAGHDGIDILTHGYGPGSTINQGLVISNASVSKAGSAGIYIRDDASYGRDVDGISLSNISLSTESGGGVYVIGTAYGPGGYVGQKLTVMNAKIAGTGAYGVAFSTYAGAGGSITADGSLTNLTISAARGGVLVVAAGSIEGAPVSQAVTMTNVSVVNSEYDGILGRLYSIGALGGLFTVPVTQSISLANVTATGDGGTGIGLTTFAEYAVSRQTLAVTGAVISNDGGHSSVAYGVLAKDSTIGAGAYSYQSASLSNVSVSNMMAQKENVGIQIDALETFGSNVVQSVSANSVSATHAGTGVNISANANNYGAINQTVTMTNVSVVDSQYDGIQIAAAATGQFGGFGAASVTQSTALANVTVTDDGGTGIDLIAFTSYSTSRQTLSVSGAVISNDGGHSAAAYGVQVQSTTFGPGTYSYQSAKLNNVSVSNMMAQTANVGIAISANAQFGSAIVQSVSIDSAVVTHAGTGLAIGAGAFDEGGGQTTVDQTVNVTGSTFANNSVSGISIADSAGTYAGGGYHSVAATSQTVSITATVIDNNGVGLSIVDSANSGASANQSVSLYGVDIEHNAGDGVYVLANAQTTGFAGQSVVFRDSTGSYNKVAYNGGDGIDLKSVGTTAGEINQHLYVYNTNVYHNAGDGIGVSNATGGYFIGAQVYYTHLQQNLIVAYGSVSHNGGNGMSVTNTVGYAAQADQVIQLYRVSVDYNAADGFRESSTATTYHGVHYTNPTNLHSDLYIQYADVSHNGLSGIAVVSHLNSPLYKPGNVAYSYLEQHITVASATVDHNGGSGFVDAAYDQGVFGINIHYVTLQGSDFSSNGRYGAIFLAHQFYGPGAFGAAEQIVTIAGSTFDHNVRSGLYAYAYAGGNQGRAEQHVTLQSLAVSATSTLANHFDYNGQDGIYLRHVAQNGVYVSGLPCTAVQGLTGGCAFVRTTFDMFGGTANGNRQNGFVVSNYASNFAAVYDDSGRPHAPTVYLNGVQLSGNKYGSGFNSYTSAKGNSYAFSFLVAIDSNFNNNRLNGFNAGSYATKGSAVLEQNILYSYKTGTTVNGNGGFGVALSSRATAGSAVYSQNELFGTTNGITVSHNGYDGVFIETGYDDATSRAQQINYFRGNTISYNGHDGVALIALGNGAGSVGGGFQYSKLVANTIAANARYGLYGLSATGADQIINVYAGGNTVAGNGVQDFHFVNAGGALSVAAVPGPIPPSRQSAGLVAVPSDVLATAWSVSAK